jgi:hypothetical protein
VTTDLRLNSMRFVRMCLFTRVQKSKYHVSFQDFKLSLIFHQAGELHSWTNYLNQIISKEL